MAFCSLYTCVLCIGTHFEIDLQGRIGFCHYFHLKANILDFDIYIYMS